MPWQRGRPFTTPSITLLSSSNPLTAVMGGRGLSFGIPQKGWPRNCNECVIELRIKLACVPEFKLNPHWICNLALFPASAAPCGLWTLNDDDCWDVPENHSILCWSQQMPMSSPISNLPAPLSSSVVQLWSSCSSGGMLVLLPKEPSCSSVTFYVLRKQCSCIASHSQIIINKFVS